MSSVIEALKAEHAKIRKNLAEIDFLDIHTKEGRKALLMAKEGLLAHLKHEDENLYPKLLAGAQSDPILADALEFFNDDMSSVATTAMAFFEKYEDGCRNHLFTEDYSNLVHVLSQRIQKEEAVIYEMFNQLENWED